MLRLCAFAAMLLLHASCVFAQNPQGWPEVDLSFTSGRCNLLVPTLARLDTQKPNPIFAATGVVGTFTAQRHLLLSLGYLFAELPQSSQTAHVPLLAITPVLRAGRWQLADTNRFERLFNYSTQPWRYRNRFVLDGSFGHESRVHLYATNEYFVNLSTGSWNQNRVELGAGWRLSRRLRADLFVLQRSAPRGNETTAVGSVLTVDLSRLRAGPLSPAP